MNHEIGPWYNIPYAAIIVLIHCIWTINPVQGQFVLEERHMRISLSGCLARAHGLVCRQQGGMTAVGSRVKGVEGYSDWRPRSGTQNTKDIMSVVV